MFTFMELEKGDKVYYIDVDKFTLPFGKFIKSATVEDIVKHPNSSTYNVLIKLSNGKEPVVNWNSEAQKVDKSLPIGALTEMDCTIYGTSEKACKEYLKKAVDTNADVLRKYLTKIQAQIIKITNLQVEVSRIQAKETPETVTTEAVYV